MRSFGLIGSAARGVLSLLPALVGAVLPFATAVAQPGRSGGRIQPRQSGENCAEAIPTANRRAGALQLVLASPPLRLVDLEFYDRLEEKHLHLQTIRGSHYWPGKYDLVPKSGVKTQWEPVGDFTSDDVVKLIASDCYRTSVTLNGINLGAFNRPNSASNKFSLGDSTYLGQCPNSKKCLYLAITQGAWAAAKAPWLLEISVTRLTKHVMLPTDVPKINEQGDVIPPPRTDYQRLATSRAQILANPGSEGSYFAKHIYPTFQHARCQNCHSLGSVEALVSRHAAVGPAFAGYSVSKISTPTGPIISCSGGCHVVGVAVPNEEFEETEWKAPAFERDIDWRQKSALQTCSRVKANLPTELKASKHFYEDARIAWAVHSGKSPYGVPLGEAPPGTFAKWRELLEPWLRGTMPCP